ncbi:HCLS1-associated protein X-1-like [Anneissia japonica]|uniref:HCLS1-associated protein X-1-like n=1 Tax=Anneissia japonica TaxID=1529436 RepID=UPI001425B33C|nr:HCLS1-associated protein X-1-like [Anneissia japonica]
MNFNDLFRSIFGFPSRSHYYDTRDDGNITNRCWDDEDGQFGDIHDQFFRETQEMFSHFQEMFSNFGIAEFPQIGFPEVENDRSFQKAKSPREDMLKSDGDSQSIRRQKENARSSENEKKLDWFSAPNHRPFLGDIFKIPEFDFNPHSNQTKREDSDLDSHIDSSNIDLILPKERDEIRSSPSRKSVFRSVSIRTIRLPDGTVETQRTEKDSDGNVKTTITKTDQDGQPAIITKNDEDIRPFIRREDKNKEITPLKDNHKESIFKKLFGSW